MEASFFDLCSQTVTRSLCRCCSQLQHSYTSRASIIATITLVIYSQSSLSLSAESASTKDYCLAPLGQSIRLGGGGIQPMLGRVGWGRDCLFPLLVTIFFPFSKVELIVIIRFELLKQRQRFSLPDFRQVLCLRMRAGFSCRTRPGNRNHSSYSLRSNQTQRRERSVIMVHRKRHTLKRLFIVYNQWSNKICVWYGLFYGTFP